MVKWRGKGAGRLALPAKAQMVYKRVRNNANCDALTGLLKSTNSESALITIEEKIRCPPLQINVEWAHAPPAR